MVYRFLSFIFYQPALLAHDSRYRGLDLISVYRSLATPDIFNILLHIQSTDITFIPFFIFLQACPSSRLPSLGSGGHFAGNL